MGHEMELGVKGLKSNVYSPLNLTIKTFSK